MRLVKFVANIIFTVAIILISPVLAPLYIAYAIIESEIIKFKGYGWKAGLRISWLSWSDEFIWQ